MTNNNSIVERVKPETFQEWDALKRGDSVTVPIGPNGSGWRIFKEGTVIETYHSRPVYENPVLNTQTRVYVAVEDFQGIVHTYMIGSNMPSKDLFHTSAEKDWFLGFPWRQINEGSLNH